MSIALAPVIASALQHYPAALVTIEVRGEPDERSYSVTISPPRAGPYRTSDERDNMIWVAVRTWDGGHETITSEECPAVARVAASMDSLPSISISPPSRAIIGPRPMSVPPTPKDGLATSLSFRTRNSDGSDTDITLRGGTQYDHWASSAISELASCWGPIARQ